MGRGTEANRKLAHLPVHRFCLQITNTIARATRWAVFEPKDAFLARRIRGQVLTYFDCLNDLGAFATEAFKVRCDVGVSGSHDSTITILLEFQPSSCAEPLSLALRQTASGCHMGSAAFVRTCDP
jgi:phage tail sheath protein FI